MWFWMKTGSIEVTKANKGIMSDLMFIWRNFKTGAYLLWMLDDGLVSLQEMINQMWEVDQPSGAYNCYHVSLVPTDMIASV